MASSSIQACCTGCSVPSGFANPSIVVMSLSARSAIVNAQARLSLPPTSTLHAPQLLSSQPYLQPVSRNTSRRYHNSGMAGSPVWRKCLPLMETSMPLRMGSGTILAGGVCGAWGIRSLYSLRQDGSSPDRGGATAVFIGHAAACRYGPGLNTVRVERSERSERSRNACCPSTPALRAYAQGQRIEAGPLPHGACDCVLRGRTQHLSALSARPRAFASHPSMTASTAAPLAPEAPWVVLKFGGTSVATVDRWRTIQRLAVARRAEGARVVVVVSALAGVTDALKALCVCAPVEREGAVAKLVGLHRALASEMGLAETAEMDRRLASLQTLMIESQDFPPIRPSATFPR